MKILAVKLIIIALLAATTNTVVNAQQEFLTYENPAYGVKILYPDNWEKFEEDLPHNVVVTFNPTKNDPNPIIGGIDVLIAPVPPNLTLDDYTRDYILLLGVIYTEFRIVESVPTTLADNPAHKIVYTGRPERDDILDRQIKGDDTLDKVLEVWTIKENKAYIISYYAEQRTYDNYVATVQKMIDSFEIDTGSLPKTNGESSEINIGMDGFIILFVLFAGFVVFLAIRRHSKRKTSDMPTAQPVSSVDSNGEDGEDGEGDEEIVAPKPE